MRYQLYIGPPYLSGLREVNLVTTDPFTERKSLARLDEVLAAAYAGRVPIVSTVRAPEYGQLLGPFNLLTPTLLRTWWTANNRSVP
ncbi:protein of unknown function [Methylocaldum szegediense]|uniref:Uncharacterized protein n=1 Tax=Methylocaldum szegediense TaxID=73780 RepID=A0ABM9HYP6_9GAMM|nr:protein of unknown function [Methylocaldum szegediense]